MYKFGYQNEYKELDFNKLNFDNYPNLVNYLSLIISYYGIYEIDKNINHLKGTVDIIENNLLGNLHFNIKDCNYLYDIKLKKNNLISNKCIYIKSDKIKDAMFLLGNYKKNIVFKLSSYNNLILTDIKTCDNKNLSIYQILELFGNKSNNEYHKLWKKFDDLIKENLICNNFNYEIFKKKVVLKKDKINYEYKSNFIVTKDFLKMYINTQNFSNFMINIKKFYKEIEVPIFNKDNVDTKYENNFPNSIRGKNNYNKLFKNRKGKLFDLYQEIIENKLISNN